jgi:hypothetical protein
LFLGKLAMCGGRRVDDQRLGITDIGQVREELDAVDEFLPGCGAGY